MLSNSWIIVELKTNKAIMETWNESALKYLKPEFKAVPTHEYLFHLNRTIKNNQNTES